MQTIAILKAKIHSDNKLSDVQLDDDTTFLGYKKEDLEGISLSFLSIFFTQDSTVALFNKKLPIINGHLISKENVNVNATLYLDYLNDNEADVEIKLAKLDPILLSDLIEHSNDMIFIIDIDTMKLEYVNETTCNKLGYTSNELLELGVEGVRKPLPNDISFKEHIDELKGSTDGLTDYAILVCKNGEEIYIEAKVRIINIKGINYNIAIVRDITERVELINKLQYQNSQIQHYLDVAQVLIMVLDNNKHVVMINQAGADMVGYTKEEMIGKDWMENFLPKKVKASVNEVGDDLLKNKPKSPVHENPILTRSGEERMISWRNSTLVDEKGEPIGILTSGVDVTDERDRERQLILHTKQAQMGEMISMIAHQWRQPLASIAATVSSLRIKQMLGEYDEGYFNKELNKVENFTLHLSNTINDFREFFKEDKLKISVTLEKVVDSSLSLIDPLLKSKNVIVKKQYLSNEELLTYPNELKQVVLNLIKNAQEVIEEKQIEKPKIEIKTSKDKDGYYISIKDNAGGIPEEIKSKIFEPYFTTKGILNGTGLGLYMSKKIIEEHCNGRITVENIDNGALFSICIKK